MGMGKVTLHFTRGRLRPRRLLSDWLGGCRVRRNQPHGIGESDEGFDELLVRDIEGHATKRPSVAASVDQSTYQDRRKRRRLRRRWSSASRRQKLCGGRIRGLDDTCEHLIEV